MSLTATGTVDFAIPPDLQDLLGRVRTYVEEEALPAEAEIEGSASACSA